MQTSQGNDTGCTAAPGTNTGPISVGFWASRSLARSPDRPGLHRASHLRSVLQRASGFFPTRPHGARPDCLATPPPACSCLRLAVASNLLRRGLAPPIQGHAWHTKDKPSGRPPSGAVLTAAARDGRTFVRAGMEEWLRREPNKRMASNRRAKCRQTRYPDPKPATVHETGASPESSLSVSVHRFAIAFAIAFAIGLRAAAR